MNFTAFLQAVIALFAAIITTFAVPYIKSRTTASQQSIINNWVKIAVTSIEQTCKDARGEEKKKKVLAWLHQHGIIFDDDQIDAMLEAAVYEMKSGIIKVDTGTLVSTESEERYGIG